MRIDSSGNVGIGTSSPVAKNHLRGSGTSGQVTASWMLENSSSGTAGMDITGSAGASRLRFLYGGGPGTGTNSLTEAMCLLTEGASAGNVGIGTTSPSGNMQILTATAGTVLNVNHDTGGTYPKASGIGLGATSTALTVSSDGSTVSFAGGAGLYAENTASSGNPTNLVFWTNLLGTPAERMRIDSSGNVLIHRTSPATSQKSISFTVDANGTVIDCGTTYSGFDQMRFRHNGNLVGTVNVTASATSYNTSSDYRLKTDAQPMTGASARVQALNPVNFEWIASGERVDGFLAHEAQEVVPEAVTGTKDAVNADGNPEYQGIDQSKLVPLLTAALQEALTKIDALETRITALEG